MAVLSLVGCAKDSVNPDAGNNFSLNVGNTNCLDSAGSTIQGFFNATASSADLHGVWGCAEQVLSDFTQYTEGASPDGYTNSELQGFLSKYYFQTGISTSAISTTMKLKAALVGGAPDFVKRSEISRLVQVIGLLDQATATLVPVSKILFTDAHLSATDGDWMNAYNALNAALNQLGGIPVQDYALSDLSALIQAWAAQLNLPSDNFIVKVGSYVPMIGQAKALLIAGSNTTVAAGEWRALFNAIGPIYSYYRMYKRIDQSSDLSSLLPATRTPWIVQGVINTLSTAVQRRAGGIPLSEIQSLLTTLQAQGIFPSGFSVAQITSAVQFLLNKVFLASGAPIDTLSSGTVAQLQALVTNWTTYDSALTSGDYSGAADFGAAVKPNGAPLMLDSQGRVDFQLRGSGVFHEYSVIFAVIEWIGSKYSAWPVAEAPFDTAVSDFLGVFHTLGWLASTQPSISTSLMKEANLFVMSANGDLILDKAEAFQYAVYALSSYRASNLLSTASSSCNNVDSCITAAWFTNRATLLANFPNLLSWLGSSSSTWNTYSGDVATVAGSDSWLMQFMVVHFIETYMARFDADSNQLITVSESLTGFPVFHPILTQILIGQGLTDGDAEPMYTYLFKYGSPPSGFSQDLQYYQWKSSSSSWSYNADRLALANILSALNQF